MYKQGFSSRDGDSQWVGEYMMAADARKSQPRNLHELA